MLDVGVAIGAKSFYGRGVDAFQENDLDFLLIEGCPHRERGLDVVERLAGLRLRHRRAGCCRARPW